MSAIYFSVEAWPLIITKFTGPPTNVDLRHFFIRCDEVIARAEPYVMVTDVRQSNVLESDQRRIIADWVAENEGQIAAHCLGQTFVAKTLIQRMIIRGVFMLKRLPAPYVVVEKPQAAQDWCLERLKEGGVDIGPLMERVDNGWQEGA